MLAANQRTEKETEFGGGKKKKKKQTNKGIVCTLSSDKGFHFCNSLGVMTKLLWSERTVEEGGSYHS